MGNAGNVSLTSVAADGAPFPAGDLALGASSVAQATLRLTRTVVDAGAVSPIELGLAFKYVAATLGNEVSLILPEGTKNGADTLVVLDSEGRQEGFGTLHVTPKGML